MTRVIALLGISSASPCPACGQPLSPTALACSECGLVPALRGDVRRRVPYAAMAVVVVAVAALVAVALSRNAGSPLVTEPRSVAVPATDTPSTPPEPHTPARRAEQRVATVRMPTHPPAPAASGWGLKAMVATSTLAALLLCGLALSSGRARRGAVDGSEHDRLAGRSLLHGVAYASAGAAFASAAILAVLLANQPGRVLPASPPTANAEVDELRREVSRLNERLRIMDSRLRSAESRRAAGGTTTASAPGDTPPAAAKTVSEVLVETVRDDWNRVREGARSVYRSVRDALTSE